ncbi:hypothetical protein FGG79_14055 [Bacillus sp. BHET2]|nr:hypothetical protein FGG79_14055 [Bacillus sp. BHET2]
MIPKTILFKINSTSLFIHNHHQILTSTLSYPQTPFPSNLPSEFTISIASSYSPRSVPLSSSNSAPIIAPFVLGVLGRLLLPFGLHPMLTVPINYTELGGTYTILTGSSQ